MDRDRNRLWLLAYDIADARRWQRVYRVVRPRFHRINWSVFLGEATLREIEDLAAELNLLIDPRHDDLRIYALATDARIWTFGASLTTPDRPACRPARQLLEERYRL